MMEVVTEVPIIVRTRGGEVSIYCRCGEVIKIRVEELVRVKRVKVRCRRGHENVVELRDILFLKIVVESA